METFLRYTMISILALAVTFLISQVVYRRRYPQPLNWIEYDCMDDRPSYGEHLLRCGLNYPAVFLYCWYGVFWLTS